MAGYAIVRIFTPWNHPGTMGHPRTRWCQRHRIQPRTRHGPRWHTQPVHL